MDDHTAVLGAWLDQEDRRVTDIIRAHGCFIQASVAAYQLTWDAEGAFPWEFGYPYSTRTQPRPGDFGPA